jgi:hypothetical protein
LNRLNIDETSGAFAKEIRPIWFRLIF